MAKSAKTATERSRARRYRARLSRLTRAEKRWLAAYEKPAPKKPAPKKRAPKKRAPKKRAPKKRAPKWSEKKLASRALNEIARVLEHSGIEVERPFHLASHARGNIATFASESLLTVNDGGAMDEGEVLSADWSLLGRGTRDGRRVARAIGIHSRHAMNLRVEMSWIRALKSGGEDTMTDWASVCAMTTFDNLRIAVPRRLRELAEVPSDIRIEIHAWQIYAVKLPRKRHFAGAKTRI